MSAPTLPGRESRFGDRTFVWDAPGSRTRGTSPALVTQVGRAFQNAHPDVPVLFDHGRHLVVERAAVETAASDEAVGERSEHVDWRWDPLFSGVVVERRSVSARRPDRTTATIVDELSQASFVADLTHLAGLPTRHSLTAGFTQAAAWAATKLSALGYAVTRVPISVGSGASENVVAERPGSGSGPRDLVLVTAHLDSINLAGGSAAAAPGADDNASGSAGALELARVLTASTWRHDLRVILFGGEEQGLFGSRQYVAALPPGERSRIRAVLNMDMIGSLNVATPTVLLEGAPRSAVLLNELATAAATYTALTVETSLNPFASDHVPFLDAGIPAVLTIEGADSANGNIHSDRDVLSTVTPSLAMEILRMNVGALVGWLEPLEVAVPRPAGPVVSWGPGRIDIFVTGTDRAMYHAELTAPDFTGAPGSA